MALRLLGSTDRHNIAGVLDLPTYFDLMAPRWNELHRCVSEGSIARVTDLVSTGSIDIDEGGPQGFTPLMIAAKLGHARLAKALLIEGASISILSDGGASALTLSVDNGHVAAARVLLEAGADPETKTAEGYTLLHVAVDRGHSHVTKLLIRAGANVHRRTPHGETALYLAAAGGHVEAVVELVCANADPNLRTGLFTPMEIAAGKGYSRVVLELIQRVGIAGCGGASRGADALTYAAQKHHVDTMAVLTCAGVVDTGAAALTAAIKHSSEKSAWFLLQQWAGGNIAPYLNSANPPVLMSCVISVCSAARNRLGAAPRIARMLVDAGAPPTAPLKMTPRDGGREETYNTTPLHLATDFVLEKKVAETTLSEEQLHALQAVRRLLLQEEAVHAVSWLWPRDVPMQNAGGARKTTSTAKPLMLMVPIVRRWAGKPARRVVLRALFRWVWTIVYYAMWALGLL